MQPFVVLLFVGTFVFSQDPILMSDIDLPQLHGWALAAMVVLPKVVLAGAYMVLCRFTLASARKPQAQMRLRRLDRATAIYRFFILALYFNDLAFGVLAHLRQTIGPGVILVSELLVMAPPLGMLLWSWWAYYPIDCWLRHAQLIRRIDDGLPIHPVWTRGQYMTAQIRYQIALLFVPLTALLVLFQVIEHHVPASLASLPIDLRPVLHVCGAGCIFLFAPVMIRHIWDTSPLPDGDLRTRLLAMCTEYRVGVRELLIWHTFGGMVNAAVMGLIKPLRYILLSDALLEMVHPSQVEAVMAHELAHVRRKHIIWLLACAGTFMLVFVLGWNRLFVATGIFTSSDAADLAVAPSMMCWFSAFGWVSRRIERQADTFAVEHLSARTGAMVVDQESINTMVEALEQIARFNYIDSSKRSWRHGSIAWRQDYLRTLVARPLGRSPIEVQIFWIKCATVIGLIVSIVYVAVSSGASLTA